MSDTKETKGITGSNGTGIDRQYKFELTQALDGLTVMNDYTGVLVEALPEIQGLFAAYMEMEEPADLQDDKRLEALVFRGLLDGDSPVVAFARIVPHILTTPRMKELCKIFLANAKVDDQACDADGMCTMFARRPHEIYVALFWSLVANYPDYMLPLLGALDTEGAMTDDNSAEK